MQWCITFSSTFLGNYTTLSSFINVSKFSANYFFFSSSYSSLIWFFNSSCFLFFSLDSNTNFQKGSPTYLTGKNNVSVTPNSEYFYNYSSSL